MSKPSLQRRIVRFWSSHVQRCQNGQPCLTILLYILHEHVSGISNCLSAILELLWYTHKDGQSCLLWSMSTTMSGVFHLRHNLWLYPRPNFSHASLWPLHKMISLAELQQCVQKARLSVHILCSNRTYSGTVVMEDSDMDM